MSESATEFGHKPSDVGAMLLFGIHNKLCGKYTEHFPLVASTVASAVMSFALAESTGDEVIAAYVKEHQCFVEQQALLLQHDEELATAFSILYSFTLVRLGTKFPERSSQIAEKSTELGLYLRSTREIFDTEDAAAWLAFIREYARKLMET
jgi:hypothetical protein